MPVRAASLVQETPAKKKFRTVVGFHSSSSSPINNSQHRRRRKQGSSVSDVEFFEREAIVVEDSENVPPDTRAPQVLPPPPALRMRAPVRMDAQDGPWSVSVAESPHDSRAYSLYIKTPTHNLTLTRTATEILELDHKLREGNPNVKLPPLPVDASSLPPPTKRKSTFLNTLSRLASPSSAKSQRKSTPSSVTPITSPSNEANDPFLSFATDPEQASLALPAPSAISTALAAYFTTVSNTPALRQGRVWKRFVRVRTDDLESVRVERAIKRVRSDLAAHVGLKDKVEEKQQSQQQILKEEDITFDDKQDEDAIVEEAREQEEKEPGSKPADDEEKKPVSPAAAEDESAPETPTSRVHRSQSADPDKSSSRLSRSYTSPDTPGVATETETGDESSSAADSSSAHGRRRKKKRSKSQIQQPKPKRKVIIDDFEMMRVLGKGCAGKVLLVRHKNSSDLYALKAITKRHVLAHQELQHTLTEQAVLKRMAAESRDPFVVKLWWSFHDKENLFLVMDFHPGGDLATQLARWGRLGRDRARFYAAEIVEGVEGLHAAGVIYRDLKPENILIGADGHIVLTDFGLSKEFPRRVNAVTAPSTPRGGGEFFNNNNGVPATPPWMKGGEMGWPSPPQGQDSTTTFCGTAEYLAPEVIQGLAYSYEIDWWSFGTMLYEMLTGITPFWAANHSDMYVRVLQDELQFPDERAIDQDTKSLIRGLLQKNPALRICEPRIKRHPYFSMIDWSHVYYKRYIPPYIPPIDPSNASDTQNFDDTFLDMQPVLDDPYEDEKENTDNDQNTDTDRDEEEDTTTPSQSRSSSVVRQPEQKKDKEEEEVDVFDGYSYKARHSVILDDEEEEEEESSTDEESEEEEEEAVQGTGLEPETPKAELGVQEEEAEPKTPEARPAPLPEEKDVLATATPVEERKSKDLPRPTSEHLPVPEVPEKEVPAPVPGEHATAPPSVHPAHIKSTTATAKPRMVPPASRPQRREKSGIPALDKDILSEDEGAATELDLEDDDWDFIEADGGEDKNGARGTSYFARGIVDAYKLAVFRKPDQQDKDKDKDKSRGRDRGLKNFRKRGPRQFLQPKTPPSSYSSRTSGRSSTTAGSSGFLTPSHSMATMESPSLKSRPSATSVGAQSSSDQSVGENGTLDAVKSSPTDEKGKNKKLKKYKENAEKMLSIFSGSSSPRPQHQQPQQQQS